MIKQEVKEVKQSEEETVNSQINRFEHVEKENVNSYIGTIEDSCYPCIDPNIVDKNLQCQASCPWCDWKDIYDNLIPHLKTHIECEETHIESVQLPK